MNSMALRYGDDIIVIDGDDFPEERALGVDTYPGLQLLRTEPPALRALLLTHATRTTSAVRSAGRGELPVYAAPSPALVERRLTSTDAGPGAVDRVKPGEKIEIGPFHIESSRHALDCERHGPGHHHAAGSVIFTAISGGSHAPTTSSSTAHAGGIRTARRAAAALGLDNVMAGAHGQRAAVRPRFEEIFRARNGRDRYLLQQLGHRLQQILDLAAESAASGLPGRSMLTITRSPTIWTAARSGLHSAPASESCSAPDGGGVVSGTQGEPMWPWRVGGHKSLDRSRRYGGDERSHHPQRESHYRMINHLSRRGRSESTDHEPAVHVSATAAVEELNLVLNLCARDTSSIHGEYRQFPARQAGIHCGRGLREPS